MSSPLRVCRVGDNTIESETIPIFFVPGVMGSRLEFHEIDERWDPDSVWAMLHWLWISAETARQEMLLDDVDVMTEHDDFTEEQVARGWGGVTRSFYGQILEDLEGQQFGHYRTPVYAMGYDWRRDNRASAADIAERIRAVLKDGERFIVISHSMGGLVTRAMLKEHSDLSSRMLGIIHVAQPVLGAVVFYRRMFTGGDGDYDDSWALNKIMGDNRVKFQTLISALTGPMQLMVTPDYRTPQGAWWLTYEEFDNAAVQAWEGETWELYANGDSPPGLVAAPQAPGDPGEVVRQQLQQRIAEAKAFHTSLGLYKHDKTWSIYSTGLETDTATHFQLPPKDPQKQPMSFGFGMAPPPPPIYEAKRSDGTTARLWHHQAFPMDRGIEPVRTEEGDNTVSRSSAQGLFPDQSWTPEDGTDYDERRQFEVQEATHDAICHHAQCEAAIFDIIRHLVGS